jgi:hypothetical protein
MVIRQFHDPLKMTPELNDFVNKVVFRCTHDLPDEKGS